MTVKLSYSIRASRIERCILCLWNCLYFTKHFWCWSLIKSTFWLYCSYSFKHICNTNCVNICCCTWCIPWCCNKWLCCKVIYFISLWYLHSCNKWYDILHISIDKLNLVFDVVNITIINYTLSSHKTIYVIALFKKKLC